MSSMNHNPTATIRRLSGIGDKLARRIVEDLGDGDPHVALGIIERNPYRLTLVDGIAFKKADRVASQDYGIQPDDERRHEAGNRFILEQKGVLNEREYSAERLKLDLRNPEHKELGVEVEDGLYWLPEELEAEKGLESWIRSLSKGEPVLADLTPAQLAVCEAQGLDEVQRDAVRAILGNPALELTGGAGSGKTHVIATAAMCADTERQTMRGMAFAGKAADRMREQFDKYGVLAEASTIHKALGFQKGGFTTDQLGENLVVIDEASMLPNWLLWAVVKRLAPGTRIVLVGDPNQLPPIGYGTPFVDMIKAGVPRAHLSKNYRQQDQQGILHMAQGILERKRAAPADCVEMHLGIEQSKLEEVFRELVERHGGEDFENWQAITYQNENAERYNLTAQEVINPHGQPLFEYPLWKLKTPGSVRPDVHAEIRVGDKLIVTKNSTLLGIFNGQTGRAVGLVSKPKKVLRKGEVVEGEMMSHLRVTIGKQAQAVDIPEDELEKYVQLGYVITVHKAQGSDWDRVIIMQPGTVRNDTARRFFYTAVTRAKSHLVIVSMQRAVGWWTNAAADAPDEPSSLIRRLEKPAYECSWCMDAEDDCPACKPAPDDYQPEPGPEYDVAIEAAGMARPLLESEWRDIKNAAQPVPTTWRGRAAAVMAQPERPSVAAAPIVDAAQVERVKAQFRNMEVA